MRKKVDVDAKIVDRLVRKIKMTLKEQRGGGNKRGKTGRNVRKGRGNQRGGGVAGEILSGVESGIQVVANALMDLCGRSSGGTGGDVGTLARDLVGTVENISCATGKGLNVMDNLLELPANLGTAYRDPGSPGANLN